MAYYVGSMARIVAEFRNLFGDLADPTVVSLTVVDPNGDISIWGYNPGPIVRVSLGTYYYDLTPNLVGPWLYEWTGTGTVTAVQPSAIDVLASTNQIWSYSGDPRSSVKDEIRFLISDTDKTKAWTLYDAEINYAISLYSPVPLTIGQNYQAASVLCDTVLAKFKTVPSSKSVGDLSITYGGQFQYYSELGYRLRQKASLQGVKVFVGGTSRAEKAALNSDPDRVGTAVKIDGMNYALPQEDNNPLTQP